MGLESAFVDLRRLADWFASLSSSGSRGLAGGTRSGQGGSHREQARDTRSIDGPRLSIERVVLRLGAICVPLLGREVGSRDPRRREAARVALAQLATKTSARSRVIAELRRIAASDACDDGKVCALGLLAELGERAAARFTDPSAIQRRSAIALAAQLDNAADVAAAADMMIHQLADDEIVHLLEVMVDASSGAAYHLAIELCARLDLSADTRDRIADLALGQTAPLPVTSRTPRPTHVAVLADASGRAVVVASRKISGERRWRRWAVLIGPHGAIDDCIHEEMTGADGDHAPLVASLVADGYQVVTTDVERARGIVAAAARLACDDHDGTARLSSAYYLGRDLLDLGEAHLGGRAHAHPTSNTLGRAVELIADHDIPRAQVLLARCDESAPELGTDGTSSALPRAADVAAATAACLIAQQRIADALGPLARAIELEPDYPLHHWNLAAVLHQLGDLAACYQALRRFIATSANPTGLYADPDQPSRVALATRLMAELERTARLAGTPLARPRRKRRARTNRAPQAQGS